MEAQLADTQSLSYGCQPKEQGESRGREYSSPNWKRTSLPVPGVVWVVNAGDISVFFKPQSWVGLDGAFFMLFVET